MDILIQRVLQREAVKLYGLDGKKDLEFKFQDMTLSIRYDDVVPEEPEAEPEESSVDVGKSIVEEIEAENKKVIEEVKPKPKKKAGRPKKKRR